LEIPLARGRLDAFAAATLVVYAVVFTAFVAAAFTFLDGTALSVVLLALTVLWLLWSALYLFTWTRMRRIEHPLALHDYGVFAVSQFGDLTAPWETLQSAAVERAWTGRQLRIRLVPPTDPRHAGIVHANLNPKKFESVQREGLRYSLRVLDIGVDQLREAFAVESGGRINVG
jgi:hypothetical protein